MSKKIFLIAILSLMIVTNFLTAEIDYEIHDIGTLQTKTSQAIAINNQGQILGWYNIDGSNAGKQFFVRNRDGVFYELLAKEPASGLAIDWQYLTDDGKVYGTFDPNTATRALCVWDRQNGVIKLGVLPGKEIVAINNAGQVLIKSVVENENGKSVRSPVIWQNGQITKLKGLSGDLGIESEESYGFAMNNKGEVVGQSLVYLSYKNELYKQVHAVKWTKGQTIDLHKKLPKTTASTARAINDLGEVFISGGYFINIDGNLIGSGNDLNKINNNFLYNERYIFDKNNRRVLNEAEINNKILADLNSIWMSFNKIISVNDNGEIIAQGTTIYGEVHIMFLSPTKTN